MNDESPGYHVAVRTRYFFFLRRWYHHKHYPPGSSFGEVMDDFFRLTDVWGRNNVFVYYISQESGREQDRVRGTFDPPGVDDQVR